MSRRENNKNLNYCSRRVLQIVNEQSDEIGLEMIKYINHWHAVTTICQEEPPFKDYIADGIDQSKRGAARKALRELYLKTYSN
ncbi:hypothetical protein AB1K32_21940 [Metabacillus dongyingensis]|uniref:hypothetical protein n=1 Tax=Metabacillus dongyingensis TaxID=2874282 RepID=UPI003B8D5F78